MRSRASWRLADALAALLLFATAWSVYTLAPVSLIGDSEHTLLAAEQFYQEGNLQLEEYFPDLEPGSRLDDVRLHWVNGHLYYFFPPGSSILSAAFVPVFHLLGFSPVGPDGRPSREDEHVLQMQLAALLTSLFVVITFAVARDVLPLRWSVFISVAIAFGTPALSTASRALWSHTWGILLLGAAIWICRRRTKSGWTPLAAASVATLLSWSFLVRPTFALSAAGIVLFAAMMRARWWWLLPLVGLGWLAVFMACFRVHWGTWIPAYFFPGRLEGGSTAEALAGNLVSPSRGLLVFTPGLLCWTYLAAAYLPSLRDRSWLALAVSLAAAHWLVISTYPHWSAGACFGPRLMTDVLPWLALIGVLATRAWLDSQRSRRRKRVELAALLLVWGASLVIHFSGALSWKTHVWNIRPVDVHLRPQRLWDWSDPQFLRAFRATVPDPDHGVWEPGRDGDYDAFVSRLSEGGTLSADVHRISVSAGGSQKLTLEAGRAHANQSYWVLGSVTGTAPGIYLVSPSGRLVNIPLNPDSWTDYTIALPDTGILVNTKGSLDSSGAAVASINIPKVDALGAVGLVMYHACLVYDADNNLYLASNPVPLKLVR